MPPIVGSGEPSGGEKRENKLTDAPVCRCTPRWPGLYVLVDGRRLTCAADGSAGPVSALYYARCSGCDARYPGPWRLQDTSQLPVGFRGDGDVRSRDASTGAGDHRRAAAADPGDQLLEEARPCEGCGEPAVTVYDGRVLHPLCEPPLWPRGSGP
jgi:hypothetical protein